MIFALGFLSCAGLVVGASLVTDWWHWRRPKPAARRYDPWRLDE